jgi:two-component system sensor histidine kinase QseC
VLQPSVTRRLVLAQLATVALLWLALLGYANWQSRVDAMAASEDLARQGAALVLPLVRALADQPERLRETLQGIDGFQRSLQAPTSKQAAYQFPMLFAWWDGRQVYRSADAPEPGPLPPSGRMVRIERDGKGQVVYSEQSADGRARFLVIAPWDDLALGITLWSRSLLVAPLLISLPLLVLPAWLSVRLALRPWRRASREIEARGPDDLQPLAFVPRHRELSPLTRAVDQLLARQRAARQRERSFIADAAHELRTPIAAIQVHADALLSHPREGRQGLDRELLAGLRASSLRAARLVEQLLALTRSEAVAARSAKPVDIEALVQDSLAQLSPLAGTREVELDFETIVDADTDAGVQGDADSLRSLLDNVIGNAVKYSPAGGSVRVRLRGGADAVRITVTDEGPGIAAELRQRVFDRFFRAPDQSLPGSGLGLAIAKSAADRHGATLLLGDGPDARGLAVYLTLPRSPNGFPGASPD